MILQSLRELALREGLVDDPAFEAKPVRWVIELAPDGTFLNVVDTNQTSLAEGTKKPRAEAKLMVIPRRGVRASGIRANFLVDNAKYVLGEVAPGGEQDTKNAERNRAYLTRLQEAAAEVSVPELGSVLCFLEDAAQRSKCVTALVERGFANNDLFTFSIEGEYLHDSEALRAYWTELQTGLESTEAETAQCPLCGEGRNPAKLHNQIQIRGASTSGVPLVSFNANAFEKYGWCGNDNAPVCTACMTAYVEALRRLTKQRYYLPRENRTVSALSTVLTEDTTAMYWSERPSQLVSGLPNLRDDPKKIADLLVSPHTGSSAPPGGHLSRFYCLILTGAQGRAIVRNIHTATVAEVEHNLRRYFNTIDVDRFDRAAPIPLFLLLKAMVLNGELKRLPAELGSELWLAALFARPLSRLFLQAVITRIRVEAQDLRQGKRKVTPARAALLQLYFASHNLFATTGLRHPFNQQETTPMGLNEESTDRAYVLGRVLAVAERMQLLAQPQGLNRTIVDRFYGMASTRPKLVFSLILEGYGYHRRKALRDIPPAAARMDKLFGALLLKLDVHSLDAAMPLEEQARFGLGYYHQRQGFFVGTKSADILPPATEELNQPITLNGETHA